MSYNYANYYHHQFDPLTQPLPDPESPYWTAQPHSFHSAATQLSPYSNFHQQRHPYQARQPTCWDPPWLRQTTTYQQPSPYEPDMYSPPPPSCWDPPWMRTQHGYSTYDQPPLPPSVMSDLPALPAPVTVDQLFALMGQFQSSLSEIVRAVKQSAAPPRPEPDPPYSRPDPSLPSFPPTSAPSTWSTATSIPPPPGFPMHPPQPYTDNYGQQQPYLHHDPSSSSIAAAADLPPPPPQRSSPTKHYCQAVSCLEQPPSRHHSLMAPLPAAASPHTDDSRQPSRLHLSSSMETERERELQEGEGEERLCQRKEKLIEHNVILKQTESDFALEQKMTELLHLNLKTREEDKDSDVEFKDLKETNKALNVEEKNLTSLRREGLVYALESATTRIPHDLSMVIFPGKGEWISRSTILLCPKQRSCSFDPGGVPRKIVLFAEGMLSAILFVASWFPP